MKKAIVLLSGGVDSTTALYLAYAEGFRELHALTFLYGQKHVRELLSARAVARAVGVRAHEIIDLPVGRWKSSSLTDANRSIADGDLQRKTIPATYVPARNAVFLSIAASYADAKEIEDIYIGVSQVDYSGYVDCREEFIRAMEKAINEGTLLGTVKERPVRVHAPFLHLTKADEIRLGVKLGVDYSLTWSCYRGDNLPCGTCDSCLLRAKAFREAGVEDKTRERNAY
ncbi:MAG: 7-cyano-7-deazaguanine synthase QueC [Odoribacteraceae bacterium]|jgi:7-cyano-7-deazaguanine synthase|nr:7-cyano-7-deazaguanine synthase QueC [Odoribacteraceae bacterium]